MRSLTLTFKLILTLGLFSACNRHFSANQPDIATDALTEGQNPQGRSYTSFSEPATVQNIKDQVSFSEANKSFASNIQSIQKTFSKKELRLTIQWKGLSKNLIFSGKLQNQEALLSDQSGQKQDLEIKANCETSTCDSLNAFLKDQNGNLIGLILRSETRNMSIVETTSQAESFSLLPKEKQNAFIQARKGFSASLNSYEIYPGSSYYEIKQGENKIEGELLNIDEGSAPTKTTGLFASLGQIELIGNNQGDSDSGAELQFKITNKVGQKILTSYIKMETNIPVLSNSSPNLINQLGANILVQQILSDEDNEFVKGYITNRLVQKKNVSKTNPQSPDVSEMLKYLACQEGNKAICTHDKMGHDRTVTVKSMDQILRQDGLPEAMSLIAFMESKFDSSISNASGALGYWQFIRSTASLPMFGLIKNGKDLRTDLKASTDAAAKYFKLLLSYWNGDLKMSVISYNIGEGTAAKACQRGSDDKNNCSIERNNKLNQNKQITEIYDLNKKDFWRLYALHSFGAVSSLNGKSGQDYVLKFLGESLVSFHPEHYGYSDRAVDLN